MDPDVPELASHPVVHTTSVVSAFCAVCIPLRTISELYPSTSPRCTVLLLQKPRFYITQLVVALQVFDVAVKPLIVFGGGNASPCPSILLCVFVVPAACGESCLFSTLDTLPNNAYASAQWHSYGHYVRIAECGRVSLLASYAASHKAPSPCKQPAHQCEGGKCDKVETDCDRGFAPRWPSPRAQ